MSVAAIAAAHVVMMNSRRPYGGGGGGYNDDDDKWFFGFLGIILLGLVCFIAYVIFVSSYDRKLPTYVVQGTLHSYETRSDGKWKKIYVNILQEDGVIRRYKTSYRPHECYQRTVAVSLPVQITSTYNEWTKRTRYDSQLMLDSCAK